MSLTRSELMKIARLCVQEQGGSEAGVTDEDGSIIENRHFDTQYEGSEA